MRRKYTLPRILGRAHLHLRHFVGRYPRRQTGIVLALCDVVTVAIAQLLTRIILPWCEAGGIPALWFAGPLGA